jgi:tetratricopeptide (TPR) repeat protein
LERGDKTVELRRIQYVSFNRLGDIARMEGNLAEAQEHFEKCLSVSKELAEVVGTVEPREDLAISYSALADIARERGNVIEAEEYYGKSRDIREALAKETGSLQAYRYYAAVLFNSGVFYYISLQNLSRAKVMFEKVYEIAGKFDDGYLADLGLKAEQALIMLR